MNVAVLEDDSVQGERICQVLSDGGYSCQLFDKGTALVEQLQRQTYDLLILDWEVPDMSAEEVLDWVRQNLPSDPPVLFMSSRSLDTDISTILNAGADDYLVKPASPRIMLARIAALLRRTCRPRVPGGKEIFGDVVFDLVSTQAFVADRLVALTQKEFELALLLFRHMNRPLSRRYIMDTIWATVKISSRTVDTHVWTMRTKLGLHAENGYYLTSIYGYGYRLGRVEDDAGQELRRE